jgi:hypothetical protein
LPAGRQPWLDDGLDHDRLAIRVRRRCEKVIRSPVIGFSMVSPVWIN